MSKIARHRPAAPPQADSGKAAPVIPPRVEQPTSQETDRVAEQAQDRLAAIVRDRACIRGSGQENAGEGNVEVNERRAALSVLMSHLSDAKLAQVLPHRGGKLLKTLQEDVAWLRQAERQPVAPGQEFDMSWATNMSSRPEVLAETARRRALAAVAAAAEVERDPARAYDAHNDSLLTHLELDDPALRAQVLADTLLQFRAQRRSSEEIDRSEQGDPAGARRERDNAAGRIASSGPISAFEQRLACKQVPTGRSLDAQREYALTRLAVANHPHGSTNSIFMARNSVAVLKRLIGDSVRSKLVSNEPGLDISLYNAIHKNYSAQTPKVVDHYLRHKVFVDGPPRDRLTVLTACVEAAGAETLEEAQSRLQRLSTTHGYQVPKAAQAKSLKALRSIVLNHLAKNSDLAPLRRLNLDDRLFTYQVLLNMHGAVCQQAPSAASLERDLFYAGSAWRDVAALIHAVRHGSHSEQVEASGRARAALREAFKDSGSGFERQMLWRLDRQVESLSAEILGVAVTAAQQAAPAADAAALGEVLLAVRSALRGAVASGLGALRPRPRTAPVADLPALLDKVDRMLARDQVSVDDVRRLMTDVFRSASEVAETARGFFRRREAAIHFSGVDVELDPEFGDNLIKETALHYLLALSQTGMTWGLQSRVSADEISFVSGMRVLNSVGPTVYKRVLLAADLAELRRLAPTPDDLCVVQDLDEKKMVAVGGLVADTEHAPGGYSHLSVFAIGHGISAVALPNLATDYRAFFDQVRTGGGVYVDDRQGSFVMMPIERAIETGRLQRDEVDRLRPGFNKEIRYLDNLDGVEEMIDIQHIELSDDRPTRVIELYVPDLEDRAGRGTALTFEDMAGVPYAATRHDAGEKGAVLARLSSCQALRNLGVEVPGGAVVPPYRIVDLLRQARHRGTSVYDQWMSTWLNDPAVGEVTGSNYLDSAFYRDPSYRQQRLEKLRTMVREGLSRLLIKGGKPTPAGRALLAELEQSPALRGSKSWIARSSFTGEDRPNKSGAGQYESYPNLKTNAERLQGIVDVIACTWDDTPIENNIQFGINLQHIWPSVLVQCCVAPSVSGVAISRGRGGEFGKVSYQVVEGFGGGVAGGAPEEGELSSQGATTARLYAGKQGSLLTPEQQQLLHAAVQAIEREFNEQIEPGMGYAVDVEWVIEQGKLKIVQARVIVGA